jgi:uncharacterized protein
MDRREFFQYTAAALGASAKALAEAPMPTATLGKTGLKVSRYTVGGYHMHVRVATKRFVSFNGRWISA